MLHAVTYSTHKETALPNAHTYNREQLARYAAACCTPTLAILIIAHGNPKRCGGHQRPTRQLNDYTIMSGRRDTFLHARFTRTTKDVRWPSKIHEATT
mmetsp:Transcript_2106/g.4407  ORF Transcript_2106/g.4407 Transcript_2106/m.4407 type:complete len:98 (+) Transcript_2106:141-434(+)